MRGSPWALSAVSIRSRQSRHAPGVRRVGGEIMHAIGIVCEVVKKKLMGEYGIKGPFKPYR